MPQADAVESARAEVVRQRTARAELEQLAAANADVQAVWNGLELQKDK
jgi:hypothetical protein